MDERADLEEVQAILGSGHTVGGSGAGVIEYA